MRAKIVHILCEGATEDGFVNAVLAPYLQSHGVTAVKSVIVFTSKKKGACGGVVSYEQVKNNLVIMRRSAHDGEYERHIITSMIDFYALPNDFPGFEFCKIYANKVDLIAKLEMSFGADVNLSGFIPYLQLHEFEALLFCNLDYLIEDYPASRRDIERLKVNCSSFMNPEQINGGCYTAPSKRIIRAVEGNLKMPRYSYNKPLSGKNITSKIGVDELRRRCPHFNEWIQKLLDA